MIAGKERPKRGRPPTGRQPGRQRTFVLSDEVTADIELIAAFHAGESGTPATLSNGVRIAVKREADRIRAILAKVQARRKAMEERR